MRQSSGSGTGCPSRAAGKSSPARPVLRCIYPISITYTVSVASKITSTAENFVNICKTQCLHHEFASSHYNCLQQYSPEPLDVGHALACCIYRTSSKSGRATVIATISSTAAVALCTGPRRPSCLPGASRSEQVLSVVLTCHGAADIQMAGE